MKVKYCFVVLLVNVLIACGGKKGNTISLATFPTKSVQSRAVVTDYVYYKADDLALLSVSSANDHTGRVVVQPEQSLVTSNADNYWFIQSTGANGYARVRITDLYAASTTDAITVVNFDADAHFKALTKALANQ